MEALLGSALGLFIVFFLISKLSKKSFSSKLRRKSHLTSSEIFEINIDYDKAVEKSKNSIRLFNLKLERFEPETGTFVALSGMGLLTIGEIITISHARKNTRVEIRVESTPAIPFLLLDYGRNKKNVEAITKLIKN